VPTVEQRKSRRVPCIALYDLATGEVSYCPVSQWPDLDRSGAPPICASLRNKLINEQMNRNEREVAYDGDYFAKPARGEVRLDRCHGRPSILRAGGEPENFDLRGGFLTWDTGHPGWEFQSEFEGVNINRGTLSGYDLSTRRRRNWTLPRLALVGGYPVSGVLGYSTHTADMVFWLATRTVAALKVEFRVETSSVYAVSLQ